MLARLIPLTKLDDARLAARAGADDAAAFAVLYDRHHASLLAFCRHMLGNRHDGEDALQQTFIRAHRALLRGHRPDEPRAWLFAIARNRCRTMLGARRDAAADGTEQLERVCVDGLPGELQQRADLRELLADITRLPEDQRAALLLSELRGFSQDQIALVIGCPVQKVKALVFQARTHLLAERDARDTECVEIRQRLEVARGSELRRGLLRRHLRRCEPCQTYSVAVAAQRNELAGLMAVLPSAGLKLSVLGAVGLVGDSAAGGTTAAGLAGGSAFTGGGAAGSAAGGVSVSAATGIATKLAVVKVAAVLAVGGAAAGGATLVDRDGQRAEPLSVQQSQGAGRHQPSAPQRRSAGRGTPGWRPAATGSPMTRKRSSMRQRARARMRANSRSRTRRDKRARLRRAAARGSARRRASGAAPATPSAAPPPRRRAAARGRRAGPGPAAGDRRGRARKDARAGPGPAAGDRRGRARKDAHAGPGPAAGARGGRPRPRPQPAPPPTAAAPAEADGATP
jgi:RNA polymerase sigma factor (sigma-70 family)